jgi:hypothetical protein
MRQIDLRRVRAATRRALPRPITELSAALHELAFRAKQRRRLARLAAYHRPLGNEAALLSAVGRKTLVFTITAGRTGTAYLQRLFDAFPGTTSLHEPEPSYVPVLRRVQHDATLAREYLLEWKLPFIAAVPTPRYVETTHLFCKGFLEPALDLGLRPRFVILRRHPRAVAASYLRRGGVPGRSKTGLKYLLRPGDPGTLALPGWTARSDYQLCFWYALEMERRQAIYGAELLRRGMTAVDVTPDELRDTERFVQMAAALGFLDSALDMGAIRARHAELTAIAHNPTWQPELERIDLAADEEAVWEALGSAATDLRDRIAARYAPSEDALAAQGGSKM